VLFDVGPRCADRGRIGCAAALRRWHLRLEHTFPHQMPGHVVFGLFQIPGHNAPDFGARHRVFGKQPLVALQHAARLVNIFGNSSRADHRHIAFGQQNRQIAGRVQRQKLLAPRPGLFFDQRQLFTVFAKCETDKAAKRQT
jgi:hypothetical protein